MFAMHRPGSYNTQYRTPVPRPSPPTKKGIMTDGTAQITLDNTESLVIKEDSPLLIAEKGEKGDKGSKGDRGRKGSPGKSGPKVMTWSKEVALHSDEITPLLIFPHENLDYNLSKLEIVVEGKGDATFFLVEKQTGEKLATVSAHLTEDLTVVSHDDLAAPALSPTILSLEATTGDHEEPIKFLALTVTLKKR